MRKCENNVISIDWNQICLESLMDIRRLNFVIMSVTGWKVIMVVSHRHVMPVTFATLVLFVLFLFTGCKHSIKMNY